MNKKERWLVFFLILFIIGNIANIGFILSVDKQTRVSANAPYGEISFVIVPQAEGPTAPSVPETPLQSSPGGGGKIYDFLVDRSLIEVELKQGETLKTSLKIKNTESISQEFKIENNLKDYSVVSEDSFVLAAGEEKIIQITFFTVDDSTPGVYPGKIIIKTSANKKEIPVILTVNSKKSLFDVILDIPPKYLELLPGEDLLLHLTLLNLGDFERADVSIEYIIKDFEGNAILSQEDVAAVETQITLTKMINIPSNIVPRDYVAIAYVKYGDSFGISSKMFHVISKEDKTRRTIYLILILTAIVLVLLAFILFIVLGRRIEKLENSSKEKYYRSVFK